MISTGNDDDDERMMVAVTRSSSPNEPSDQIQFPVAGKQLSLLNAGGDLNKNGFGSLSCCLF